MKILSWKEWSWAKAPKPNEPSFRREDMEGLEFVEFKAKNGRKRQGYGVALKDGSYLRCRRVSDIKSLLGKEALINWAASQASDYMLQELEPDVSYTSEQLEHVAENAKRHWRSVRDDAAQYGTLAHEWIEAFIKRGQWPTDDEFKLLPPEVENSLMLFVKWWNEHSFIVIEAEKRLVSPDLGVCGTADLVARDA